MANLHRFSPGISGVFIIQKLFDEGFHNTNKTVCTSL